MDSPKVVNCQRCDAEIEVRSFQEQILVTCRNCGADYRLHFDAGRKAWLLQPEAADAAAERLRTENPAAILAEVGRPAREDRDEESREQSDLRADTDQAIDKDHRKG